MRQFSFAIVVAVSACVTGSMIAEDGPTKRSAELQVLDYLIGEWDTEVTVRGTGEKFNSIQSRRWSREGTFVISEERDVTAKKESHFLVTYEPKARQYRAVFINENVTVPLLGTWDESTKTMRWKSSDVPFKHDGVHRSVNKDLVEWTMTVTSPEGKVVLDVSAKQTRRKS